ncbi:MAG TPA: DUF6152 family protein [Hyphomicrobiales bacterium]|nr:DUF6152 family protein [Hyphomicrobiales bacterium]
MKAAMTAAIAAFALGLTADGVQAHHSIAGEFDQTVSFELRGVLTRLDWTNPHLWYYIDVTSENGSVESWQCTTGINPNRLLRAGWKKEDLPIGSKVVFANANPARHDEHTCYTGGLTLDDGTAIFSGRRGEQ